MCTTGRISILSFPRGSSRWRWARPRRSIRGALHASVRYFDPQGERPGLPADVAALVEAITPEGLTLTLVNTNPLALREVLVQAGGFGEHRFTEVRDAAVPGAPAVSVNDSVLRVKLGPWSQARLQVGMARYVNRPTYAFPWCV